MSIVRNGLKALVAVALAGIAFGASAAPGPQGGYHRHHVHHRVVHHHHRHHGRHHAVGHQMRGR